MKCFKINKNTFNDKLSPKTKNIKSGYKNKN